MFGVLVQMERDMVKKAARLNTSQEDSFSHELCRSVNICMDIVYNPFMYLNPILTYATNIATEMHRE